MALTSQAPTSQALTPQIQDRYRWLQEKARNLHHQVSQLGDHYAAIKILTSLINEQLAGDVPTSQDALSNKLQLVDFSLTALQRLLEPMPDSTEFAEINHSIAELQIEQQAVKALLPEEGSIPIPDMVQPDPDFVDNCLLQFISDDDCNKKLTERLLSDPTFELDRQQIKSLTKTWHYAIQALIADAQRTSDANGKILPGKPETLAAFFCVRGQLVTLYDRLAQSVS